jgi:hypothetical protein
MVEEGFLRACLAAIGGVELLFLASFSFCSLEMAEGFSMDFLPITPDFTRKTECIRVRQDQFTHT